jgi:hypothetical protein
VANSIDEVIKIEGTSSTMTMPMMGLLSTDANVGGVNGAGIVCMMPLPTNANGYGVISQARIVATQTTANTIVP